MLLNTYIQLFLSLTGFAEKLSGNLSDHGREHTPAAGLDMFKATLNSTWTPYDTTMTMPLWRSGLQNTPFIGASTTANVTRYSEVYIPNVTWIIVLSVSSVILWATSLYGIFVSCRTLVPDMFDAVTALTFDDQYFRIPAELATLDATERARKLRNVNVRIGDLKNGGEVGKVAFASDDQAKSLTRKRLYV